MPITVTGMAPLIQVFDMPTSVAFYCDVLGFKMAQRSQPGEVHFDWCMLELDGFYIMLNTAYEQHERPPAPDPKRRDHHFDMSFYFGCNDVDAIYAHLKGKGVAVDEPKLLHYGFRQVVVKDPDDFLIHFQQRA
jgi:uncharacterized glyoxalase superfamily protein PhnB